MNPLIEIERSELLEHWRGVLANAKGPFSSSIYTERLIRREPPTKHESNSMRFRKVHDSYGWAAKEKKPLGGLCRGAIYRTVAFMNEKVRCGSNPRSGDRLCRVHRAKQTVHIEHTVPSIVLATAWAQLPLETEFLPWMMRYSVCTAAHQSERPAGKGLIRKGYGKVSHALTCEPGHEDEFDKPFMRYEPGAKVWNVFTKKRVEFDSFTFDDHLNTVMDLCREAEASEESLRKLMA